MATPAGRMPGQAPNGGGPPRRPPPKLGKPVNPLVQKKKPQKPRPQAQVQAHAQHPARGANGPNAAAARPVLGGPRDLENMPYGDTTPSLFAKPPPSGVYTDFPVVMSKKAIMEGLKHHVARFSARKTIDPRSSSEFVKPLYLQRRDVRTPVPGTQEWEEMQAEHRRKEEDGAGDVERNAAREAAKAEIAPSLAKKKPKPVKKRANEAMTRGQTVEQRMKGQLKYEEALPWHFEDDEQKQIWMGTYEHASSNIWTQLKFENGPHGPRYVITPLQKWYKFLPKTRFTAEQAAEIERKMVAEQMATEQNAKAEKASPEPSFLKAFLKHEKKEMERKQDLLAAQSAGGKGLYVGKIGNERMQNAQPDENELDFEEDWADDEAPPAIEGEEDEVKDVEERIKKERHNVNTFDNKTAKEYQAEEELEELEKQMYKVLGRKTARALHKRERNALYERDDENPYSSESESTDTEVEAEREREKKEAEAKAAAAAANPSVKVKTEPGSRNSTPGNRPSKHPDPLRKTAQNLKRPGSPNLSDASGNESTAARKKLKIKNAPSKLANIPSRTHSPAPSANGGRPVPSANRSFAAGSGSDTEGQGPVKFRLSSPRSPNGSPGPSRMASRAGSPAPAGAAKVKSENIAFPKNSEELRPLIPKEGVQMQLFLNRFRNAPPDQKRKLVLMVQEVARFDKPSKLLFPKEACRRGEARN